MEQGRKANDQEQVEAWVGVVPRTAGEVLVKGPAAVASAPAAGKEHHTNWGRPAMSNDAPSVEPR